MAKKYITVKDVELARVGTWNASTGQTPITRADIDSMVDAFNSGDLTNAPIKIGHTDTRMENPDWDGDPAYGQVSNLRVTEDRGGTLLGDYINMPEELAEVLVSAYPQRSIEVDWGVQLLDVDGNVVSEFPAVLTGLALLGASAPAVKGLADVHVFSAAKSSQTVKSNGKRARIAAASMFAAPRAASFSLPGNHSANSLREAIYAGLNLLAARDHEYVDRWIEDYDDTTVWSVDNGIIMQRAYTVDESGLVVIADDAIPVTVRRVFEPMPADTGALPPVNAPADESAGVTAAMAEKKTPTEGEADMAFTPQLLAALRVQHGLDESATEADVITAMEAHAVANAPAASEAPAAPAAETPAAPAAPAAPVVEPTPSVQLSAASFAQMQAERATLAAQVKTLTDTADKERRDKAIFTAVSTGRLHPTEEKAWREALETNEAHTMTLLSARVPAFPTVEFGSLHAPHALDTDQTVQEAQLKADDAFFSQGGVK